MDGRRWWKMALQNARESLIELNREVCCFVRLVSKVLDVFKRLSKSTIFVMIIQMTKSTSQGSLGCAELHCIEETEE